MKYIKMLTTFFVVLLIHSCGGLDHIQRANYPIMVGKMATKSKTFKDLGKPVGEIEVTDSQSSSSNYSYGGTTIYTEKKQGTPVFIKNLERLKVVTRVNYYYQYQGLSSSNYTYWIDVFDGRKRK